MDVLCPVAGFERVPHDPRLSRRAFLCHTLHRNLPRLPSGEQIINNHHPIKASPKPHQAKQAVSCGSRQTIIALTITISHSSLRVFISNNLNHCLSTLSTRGAMAKFLEDQYSLSEASLWLDHSSSYLRGLSAHSTTTVFIDSPNPPLTPTYKFPRLTRLNCPAALNPQPPSDKGHRICKPPLDQLCLIFLSKFKRMYF